MIKLLEAIAKIFFWWRRDFDEILEGHITGRSSAKIGSPIEVPVGLRRVKCGTVHIRVGGAVHALLVPLADLSIVGLDDEQERRAAGTHTTPHAVQVMAGIYQRTHLGTCFGRIIKFQRIETEPAD
ncbi:MAG TPA: hypothetical protein VNG90_05145 [Candidatus Acidoferrum sp.]|nr:hypothetical protein [Candidatus Acidoferrum sp.]